jgi:hypothetical protein
MDWSQITPPRLLIVDDPEEAEDDGPYIPVHWVGPIDSETFVDGTVRDAFRELNVIGWVSARVPLRERALIVALGAASALEGPVAAPEKGAQGEWAITAG